MRRTKTAADTSQELRDELAQALAHPGQIFGFADYGPEFPALNRLSGGLQPYTFGVLAARPKAGKSMLAAGWIPAVARQAMGEDTVVRVVTLEMRRRSYQRRMAAIMAGIKDPMNIRRGWLDEDEQYRYLTALDMLEMLPIEYLSNEVDLSEEEALRPGNSPVTLDEVQDFIRGRVPRGQLRPKETFWWVLDHIGLLSDLKEFGDVTTSIYSLANNLATLAHTTAAGLVITHLNRASEEGRPSLSNIAGSDQVGKNGDVIMLLWRPYMQAKKLDEVDLEAIKDGEPAYLEYQSRDEGSGVELLWWDKHRASYREMEPEPGEVIVLPGASADKKRKSSR